MVFELLAIVALVAAITWLVGTPLLPGRADAAERGESSERAELEAARDAKYREIRDAELDYRTGKLSQADWRSQDRALRHEAVDVLRRLDALDGREGEPVPQSPARSLP